MSQHMFFTHRLYSITKKTMAQKNSLKQENSIRNSILSLLTKKTKTLKNEQKTHKKPLFLIKTTAFCYKTKVFSNKIIITPGTENIAETDNVNQLIPIVRGTKYEKAHTEQSAPTPPITLVKSALKKCFENLKISKVINNNTTKKMLSTIIKSPLKYMHFSVTLCGYFFNFSCILISSNIL